jgi:hypothetical protein
MSPPAGFDGLLPVSSPQAAREKTNAILDTGADLIKIAFEDSLPPGRSAAHGSRRDGALARASPAHGAGYDEACAAKHPELK